MTGMVNGLKKSLVTGRGEWFQSVFLASKILHGTQSLFGSLINSRRCSVRWIGGWARLLACQPAVPHIPSGAFLSLGERTLVACTNGLSVKMDPNDVTGRAKKLEEKEEEEGEELFRSALESARARWRGVAGGTT